MDKDNILIVDDEPGVLTALKRIFLDDPFIVHTAENAATALEKLKANPIKVVISDERMPGMSGSDFLSTVRQQFPNTVRIMLTGQADLESAMKAINKGEIYRFFSKPWDENEIKNAVRSAIARYNLRLT